jgi:hypothetical protein
VDIGDVTATLTWLFSNRQAYARIGEDLMYRCDVWGSS